MSSDIARRLRSSHVAANDALCNEAADEIDRLRDQLIQIAWRIGRYGTTFRWHKGKLEVLVDDGESQGPRWTPLDVPKLKEVDFIASKRDA
jgi:hypothetical protein